LRGTLMGYYQVISYIESELTIYNM